MNEIPHLILPLIAGVLLGVLFFGGLWWTVRRSVSSKQPALEFLGSSLLRTGLTLAGFYWVAQGHWEMLLVCLAGFLLGRLTVTWLTRPAGDNPDHRIREVGHASHS